MDRYLCKLFIYIYTRLEEWNLNGLFNLLRFKRLLYLYVFLHIVRNFIIFLDEYIHVKSLLLIILLNNFNTLTFLKISRTKIKYANYCIIFRTFHSIFVTNS